MIMEKQAANIAFQLYEAKDNLAPSLEDLDIHTEQALMCAIYGIVECTEVELIGRFAQYVNVVSGCTELKDENNERVIEKRVDAYLGITRTVFLSKFLIIFRNLIY